MKTVRIIATLVFVLLGFLIVNAQPRREAKIIKAKGDYIHPAARTVFPEQIEDYTRQAIYSFNQDDDNIGVVYGSKLYGNRTTITIYVYPAGDDYDGRLRTQYLASLQVIANTIGKEFNSYQQAVKFKGEKYICNGYKAILRTNNYEYNQMTVYECGSWYFKIRLTTNCLDNMQILNLEDKILEKFDPSKLTAQNPLDLKADVEFAKGVYKDSILLLASKESANTKIEWVEKHVDVKERASGFPDLYLDMHIEAINAFVKYEKEHHLNASEDTKQYCAELNKIIDAGFLKEFILVQFNKVMIIPDDMEIKLDAYYQWKQTHPLTVSLRQKLYALVYKEL